MADVLSELGLSLPLIAAPMAGGPSTPELVTATARAGGLGFLAAGYLSAEALAGQLSQLRDSGMPFGLNLFAPNPVLIEPAEYRRYADQLAGIAERYQLELPPRPVQDDDGWAAKLDLLLSDPAPVVSFTFGLPPDSAVRALRRAGSMLAGSVTSAAEAVAATEAGMDLLVLQGIQAGGHSATFTPAQPVQPTTLTELISQVRAVSPLPIIACGGIADSSDAHDALAAGAVAVGVGTLLLRATEAGTAEVHQAALAQPRGTVLTRAFTGRPARGLRNEFYDLFDADAPLGYPAVHHLTSGLRAAARAAGDPEGLHLWAGTGYRSARSAPVGQILTGLASQA